MAHAIPQPSTSIYDLPIELLREVFSYLPLFSREELDTCERYHSPCGLGISHVCRLWRAIVHEYPQLWTVIPLRSPLLTDLALHRSRQVSISIHVDLSLVLREPTYRQTAQRALHHVSRARELTFDFLLAEDQDSVRDPAGLVGMLVHTLTGYSAPLLETFSFSDTPSFDNFLPELLFAGQPLPKLRNLSLANSIVRHDSNLLTAPLISLELEECAITWAEGLLRFGDMHDLLDILTGLPDLEMLVLRDPCLGMPRPDRKLLHAPRSVALPRLKELAVQDSVDIVAKFMSFLSLPQDVLIDMCCAEPAYATNDTQPLEISLLTPAYDDRFSLATDANLSYQKLDVTLSYGPSLDTFMFSAHDPQRNASLPEVQLPQWTCFTVQAPHSRIEYTADLLSVLPSSILRDVTTVTVRDLQSHLAPSSHYRFTRGWYDMYRGLPNVETITAQGPAAVGLVMTLVAQGEGSVFMGEVFPELQVLTLQLVDFSMHVSLKPAVALDPKPSFVGGLCQFLLERREQGQSVKLYLQDCNLPEEMEKEFRVTLGEALFDWDGQHDGFTRAREPKAVARP
ncbi:hypothetical protein BV25DRAFT_1830501 [Artomyces pyxidatus]|uniref:Uncharacterized protein n=1 Tax=Artomyces pyxidatus TaxID=48021 RepID=A0ACB8SQ41_9AGAM|nr:hypothetical protein BV25DRAFT_1830501 [Artomyces pyxidatus]